MLKLYVVVVAAAAVDDDACVHLFAVIYCFSALFSHCTDASRFQLFAYLFSVEFDSRFPDSSRSEWKTIYILVETENKL